MLSLLSNIYLKDSSSVLNIQYISSRMFYSIIKNNEDQLLNAVNKLLSVRKVTITLESHRDPISRDSVCILSITFYGVATER